MCRKASFGIRARAIAPATKPSAKAASKLPRFIEPPFPCPRPILAASAACDMGRSLYATPISPRYQGPGFCRSDSPLIPPGDGAGPRPPRGVRTGIAGNGTKAGLGSSPDGLMAALLVGLGSEQRG